MILVDTSVWVGSKAGDSDLALNLSAALESFSVRGHGLVYLELLLGPSTPIRKELLTLYVSLPWIEGMLHNSIVQFVKKHELHQKGIGAIDASLLAAAHTAGDKLWTLDKDLHAAAKALDCAYSI